MQALLKMFRGRASRKPGSTELDRALAAWKEAEPTPTLSEATRRRILNQTNSLRDATDLPRLSSPLFLPTRRLVLAGAIPVLVMTLLVGGALLRTGGVGSGATDHATRVEVAKEGGEIVFLIANGKRAHRVSRSTRPDAPGEVFTSHGEFRDRLDSKARVVYYRID